MSLTINIRARVPDSPGLTDVSPPLEKTPHIISIYNKLMESVIKGRTIAKIAEEIKFLKYLWVYFQKSAQLIKEGLSLILGY